MAERTLMAVGAHADDIELNVGGTLAKYKDNGYRIIYVMSTNNMSGGWSRRTPNGGRTTSKPPYYELMPQRKLEAGEAAKFFGTEAIHLDHPQRHYTPAEGGTTELRYGCPRPDCVPEDVPSILTAFEHKPSVQRVTDLILEHKPEAILTHGMIGTNPEHLCTALLITAAYRKAEEAGHDGMLLHWLDIGISLFGPAYRRWDTFIDVSRYWEQKLHAVGLHACQIPYPERLDYPSNGPACGCQRAETFVIVGRGKPATYPAPFSVEVYQHS